MFFLLLPFLLLDEYEWNERKIDPHTSTNRRHLATSKQAILLPFTPPKMDTLLLLMYTHTFPHFVFSFFYFFEWKSEKKKENGCRNNILLDNIHRWEITSLAVGANYQQEEEEGGERNHLPLLRLMSR
jgi:hypothetical protein